MKFGPLAIVVVGLVGCDAGRRVPPAEAAADNAAEFMNLAKQAETRIAAAAQDPNISEEELAIIEVLETARQSLLLTERVQNRDLSGSAHPLGGELQQMGIAMLIDALEMTQAENETHRSLCLKTADECEREFPDHAESLRGVAAKLSTQNHITKLQLFKLKKRTK